MSQVILSLSSAITNKQSAVLATIHNATGIWKDEIPVTPERIWKALKNQQESQDVRSHT